MSKKALKLDMELEGILRILGLFTKDLSEMEELMAMDDTLSLEVMYIPDNIKMAKGMVKAYMLGQMDKFKMDIGNMVLLSERSLEPIFMKKQF